MRSPSPTLLPLSRGWAGGAQHRQPVARRPCGHERSETPTRTRPKKKEIKKTCYLVCIQIQSKISFMLPFCFTFYFNSNTVLHGVGWEYISKNQLSDKLSNQ
ncbi:MAG: hypothetical protein NZ455_10695 [Bacteroidia bacterium]|nr:hypothetical protein [Bacteroidia bacterium]MDW8347467.1 hypothetical protein [Bacteroidia bacterium]